MNVVRLLPFLTCGLSHDFPQVRAAHTKTSCRLTTNENSNQTESTYHHKGERHCTTRGTTTNNSRESVFLPTAPSRTVTLSAGAPTNVTRALRPSSPSPSAAAHGHKVMVPLSCKSRPHTPRPHFERSLAVGCWQTRHVVQHLRKSCPCTEPRQSVGGFVARAKDVLYFDKFHASTFQRQSNLCGKRIHERSG